MIIFVTVVIVVAGVVSYFFSNHQKINGGESSIATTTSPIGTSTQQVTYKPPSSLPPTKVGYPAKSAVSQKSVTSAPNEIVGVGSVSYLLSLNQSLICTIKALSAYTKRSGTIYVAKGEMRGNFVSYINGVLTSTSMVDDGKYLYVWVNNALTGLKLLAASGVSGSAIASNGGLDLAASLSFGCNPWTENPNVFVPPTAISFSSTANTAP